MVSVNGVMIISHVTLSVRCADEKPPNNARLLTTMTNIGGHVLLFTKHWEATPTERLQAGVHQ